MPKRFVPDQHKVPGEIESARELRLPSDNRRKVETSIFGIVMEMVGACWQVPGIKGDGVTAVTDVKVLYLYESESRGASVAREGGSAGQYRGFAPVESILRAVFGRAGPFEVLLQSSQKLAGQVNSEYIGKCLPDVLHSQLKKRLDSTRVRAIFPHFEVEGEPLDESLPKYVRDALPRKDLLRLQTRLNELVNKVLPSATGGKCWRGTEPVFCVVHGDLNAANIMVDIHANAWYIDFAVRALINKYSCCTG